MVDFWQYEDRSQYTRRQARGLVGESPSPRLEGSLPPVNRPDAEGQSNLVLPAWAKDYMPAEPANRSPLSAAWNGLIDFVNIPADYIGKPLLGAISAGIMPGEQVHLRPGQSVLQQLPSIYEQWQQTEEERPSLFEFNVGPLTISEKWFSENLLADPLFWLGLGAASKTSKGLKLLQGLNLGDDALRLAATGSFDDVLRIAAQAGKADDAARIVKSLRTARWMDMLDMATSPMAWPGALGRNVTNTALAAAGKEAIEEVPHWLRWGVDLLEKHPGARTAAEVAGRAGQLGGWAWTLPMKGMMAPYTFAMSLLQKQGLGRAISNTLGLGELAQGLGLDRLGEGLMRRFLQSEEGAWRPFGEEGGEEVPDAPPLIQHLVKPGHFFHWQPTREMVYTGAGDKDNPVETTLWRRKFYSDGHIGWFDENPWPDKQPELDNTGGSKVSEVLKAAPFQPARAYPVDVVDLKSPGYWPAAILATEDGRLVGVDERMIVSVFSRVENPQFWFRGSGSPVEVRDGDKPVALMMPYHITGRGSRDEIMQSLGVEFATDAIDDQLRILFVGGSSLEELGEPPTREGYADVSPKGRDAARARLETIQSSMQQAARENLSYDDWWQAAQFDYDQNSLNANLQALGYRDLQEFWLDETRLGGTYSLNDLARMGLRDYDYLDKNYDTGEGLQRAREWVRDEILRHRHIANKEEALEEWRHLDEIDDRTIWLTENRRPFGKDTLREAILDRYPDLAQMQPSPVRPEIQQQIDAALSVVSDAASIQKLDFSITDLTNIFREARNRGIAQELLAWFKAQSLPPYTAKTLAEMEARDELPGLGSHAMAEPPSAQRYRELTEQLKEVQRQMAEIPRSAPNAYPSWTPEQSRLWSEQARLEKLMDYHKSAAIAEAEQQIAAEKAQREAQRTATQSTQRPVQAEAGRPDPYHLAEHLKYKGTDRQETWSRWVQKTNLNPGMDAKDWYAIYDRVTPYPHPELEMVQPQPTETPEIAASSLDIPEKSPEIAETSGRPLSVEGIQADHIVTTRELMGAVVRVRITNVERQNGHVKQMRGEIIDAPEWQSHRLGTEMTLLPDHVAQVNIAKEGDIAQSRSPNAYMGKESAQPTEQLSTRDLPQEIWQQRREEYVVESGVDLEGKPIRTRSQIKEAQHHDAVEDALREGKPIPPEVMAEYPNLQKLWPQDYARWQAQIQAQGQPVPPEGLRYSPDLVPQQPTETPKVGGSSEAQVGDTIVFVFGNERVRARVTGIRADNPKIPYVAEILSVERLPGKRGGQFFRPGDRTGVRLDWLESGEPRTMDTTEAQAGTGRADAEARLEYAKQLMAQYMQRPDAFPTAFYRALGTEYKNQHPYMTGPNVDIERLLEDARKAGYKDLLDLWADVLINRGILLSERMLQESPDLRQYVDARSGKTGAQRTEAKLVQQITDLIVAVQQKGEPILSKSTLRDDVARAMRASGLLSEERGRSNQQDATHLLRAVGNNATPEEVAGVVTEHIHDEVESRRIEEEKITKALRLPPERSAGPDLWKRRVGHYALEWGQGLEGNSIRTWNLMKERAHQSETYEAMVRGEPVPVEVMSDYPEFKETNPEAYAKWEQQMRGTGKVAFQAGDRVITGEGRHGTITKVHETRMSSIHGEVVSTDYSYTVKTDNGAELMSFGDETKAETERPTEPVIPDPKVGRNYERPINLWSRIEAARKGLARSKGMLDRARTEKSRNNHRKDIQEYQDRLAEMEPIWDSWAQQYPEAAKEASQGKWVPAAERTPTVAPVAGQGVGALPSYNIVERSSQGGVEIRFGVRMSPTMYAKVKEELQQFGFKYSSPKKLWWAKPSSEARRTEIVEGAREALGKLEAQIRKVPPEVAEAELPKFPDLTARLPGDDLGKFQVAQGRALEMLDKLQAGDIYTGGDYNWIESQIKYLNDPEAKRAVQQLLEQLDSLHERLEQGIWEVDTRPENMAAAVDQLAQAISQLTQRSDWPDNLVQIRGSALLHIRDSKLVPQTVEGVGNAWERIESQLQGRRVTPEEAKAIIQQVLGDQSGQPTAQAADSRPVYTSTVRNGKIGATVQLDGDIVTVEWDDKGEGATRIDANDWPQDTGRPQDHQAIYLTKEEIVKRGLGVNIRLHYSNVIHMIDEALKRAKWEAHPAGENRPLTELDKEFERLRGLADGPIQRGNAREIEQLKDSLTKVYDQMPEGRRKESYNERLYDLWKALIDLGDKRREQERLAREAEAGPASGPIYTASRTDLGIKVEVQGDIVRIKPIGTSPIWRQKAAPEPIQFRLSEYPKSTEGRLSFLDSLGSRDFTSATDGVRLLISKATEKQQKEEAKRPRQAEPNEQAQPGRQTPEAIEPGVYFLLETDEAFRVFGTGERPGTWRLAKVNGGTESSYPRDWFTMNAYTIKPGQTYWDKSTGRPIKVTQVDEYGFIRIRPEDENERQVSAKWLAENATSKPPVEKEGLSPDLRALAMHIATETRGNSFLWYSERDREGLVQEVRRAASATGTPVPPEKRQIFEELVQSRIEGKKVDISEATEVIQAAVKAVQLPGVDELTPVTWRIQDRINAERDFWTNTDSQNSLLVDIMDYMSRAGAFKGADNIDVEEATAQRVMDLLRDTKPNLADARKAVSLALSQARSSTMESGGATDARTETDLREPLHDNAGRVSYEDREALEGELSESVQGIQDTSGTTGTRPASSGEYVPVRGDSGATRDESDAGGTRGGDGRSVQGTQKPDRRPVEPSEPPREPTTQTPPNPQAVLHDYRITDDDALGSGGPKTKFRDNLRAMQIIKQLREEGRKATPEEQAALVRWVGWGNSAFNKVFGEYGSYQGNAWDRQEAERNNWETEYDQLREVMDDKEFRSAAHSRLNAHYTSPEIIRGMWEAVKNMGLGKLHTIRVLEPGAGIGHFLGLMPDDLAGKAQRTAVEMDRFSGEILSNLYQNADVRIQNFQDFLYPKDSFDLVISNVPFSQEDKMVIDEWVNDGSRKWLNRESLHNQYFVRSIELLRPGGVMAAITTHFTMDAPASKPIREYIAKQADLLGAIRLPKTAFGQIAGTEVVTDILFLRKRLPGEEPNGIAWGKTVTYKNPEGPERAAINEYFHAHPEMVLGDHSFTGSMYAKNEYTVLSRGYDLGRQLQEAIGNLPKDILDNGTRDPADGILAHEWKIEESGRPPMPGSFIIRRDNTIGQWMGNVVKEVQFKGPRDEDKVRRIVQMRQSMWETNRQGTENLMEWAKSRDVLRAQFREFIRTYGLLTDDELKKLTRRDTNAAVVRALQKDDPKLIEEAQRGALVRTETIGSGRNKKQVPIYDWSRVPDELLEKLETAYFREPQMAVRKRVEHVDTAKDAMLVSMDELGRIDMNRMTELSGKTPDEIMEELGPVVYQDPGGHILLAEDYLSGNVRQKLREAEVAATRDPSFQRNVEALKAVQPEDIPPVDIAVRLGAPWIPPEIVKDFAAHLVGAEWAWNARKISVAFNRLNGDWRIRDLRNNFRTRDAYTKWSIDKKWDLEALLNKALIGGEIKIYESAGPEGKKVLDKEATALAIQKVAALHDEFRKWLWADEDRADFLGRIYNERYNAEVPRQYDGSHLTFPGMNPHIKFMGHQKNGVWRYLQSGTILLAHEVGAGKTFECIAIAMEARRLGKARKPVIIVPKNTVGQWEKAFRLLYPESNILVPNEDDFAQENRKEYVSRVMTGDWDAVILTHPQFFRIPVHYQTEIDYLDEYVEQLTILVNQEKEAQRARSQTPEGARSQKAMEKALSAAKARIALLQAEARKLKDDAVFWEDVGCDLLMVDEADEFKNLEFPTRMGQIKGVTNTGSKMATDLYMKSRGILRRNNGAGLVFGTGTPISNAVGELWTMLRYLAPGMLEKNDMHMFDMWAKVFANPSQVTEQTTTGDWATVTRLVKYDNLPELSKLWQSVADIVFSEDVPQLEKRKPRVRGGGRIAVECEASAWQKDFRKTLKYRAEHMDPNDKKSDNFLNLMTDARMAAVDPRLIDATQDLPANGKVAKLAENVSRIYNDEAEFQGTQLIFMDFGTPKSGKGADQRRATALTRARRSQETMIDALQDWRMKEILDEMKMAREMAEEAGEPFDEKPYRDRLNQLAMEPRPTLKPILDSDLKLQKSLYEEIKERLVAAGVKEEEIAFIHEAAADEEKEILFEQVRRGETRILFGSTGKMGAGTNVQDRLVAIHHLDTPWKPRDIEQREGRILRQGNLIYGPKLDDEDNVLDPGRGVEIYQYLTKDSLDTLMWQRVEYKWKMIKSIMKKNVTMRSAEEVDGDVADANMFIAITMDNPLVVERLNREAEVAQLEAEYAGWRDQQRYLQVQRAQLPGRIEGYETGIAQLAKFTVLLPKVPKKAVLTIDGEKTEGFDCNERLNKWVKANLEALRKAAKRAGETYYHRYFAKTKVGTYGPYDLYAFLRQERNSQTKKVEDERIGFAIWIPGEEPPEWNFPYEYRTNDERSEGLTGGLAQWQVRIQNTIDHLAETETSWRRELDQLRKEMAAIQAEGEQRYPKEAKLKRLKVELHRIRQKIFKNQKDMPDFSDLDALDEEALGREQIKAELEPDIAPEEVDEPEPVQVDEEIANDEADTAYDEELDLEPDVETGHDEGPAPVPELDLNIRTPQPEPEEMQVYPEEQVQPQEEVQSESEPQMQLEPEEYGSGAARNSSVDAEVTAEGDTLYFRVGEHTFELLTDFWPNQADAQGRLVRQYLKDEDYEVSGILANLANKALERQVAAKPEPLPTEPQMQLEPEMETQPEPEPQAVEIPEGAEKGPWRKWPQVQQIKDAFRTGNPWNPTYKGTYDKDKWKLLDTGVTIAHRKSGGYNVEFGQYHSIGEAKTLGQAKSLVMNEFIRAWAGLADERAIEYYRQFARQKDLPEPMTWAQMMAEGAMDKKAKAPRPIEEPEPERDPNKIYPEDYPTPALLADEPDLRPPKVWKWDESWLNVDRENPANRATWEAAISKLEQWATLGRDDAYRHLTSADLLFAFHQADVYRDALNRHTMASIQPVIYDREALLLDNPRWSDRTKPLTPHDYEVAYRRGLRHREAGDAYDLPDGLKVPNRYGVPHVSQVERAVGHPISFEDFDFWVDAWDLGNQGKPMNRFWEKPGQPEMQPETTRTGEPAPVQPQPETQPTEAAPAQPREELPRAEDMPGVPIYESARTGEGARQVAQVQGDIIRVGSIDREGTYILPISFRVSDWPDSRDAQIKLLQGQGVVKQTIETARGWISLVNKALAKQQAAGVAAQPTEAQSEGIRPEEPAPVQAKPEEVALQPVAEPEAQPEMESQRPDMESKPAKTPPVQQGTDLLRTVDEQLNEIANLMAQPEMNLDDMDRRFNEALDILTKAPESDLQQRLEQRFTELRKQYLTQYFGEGEGSPVEHLRGEAETPPETAVPQEPVAEAAPQQEAEAQGKPYEETRKHIGFLMFYDPFWEKRELEDGKWEIAHTKLDITYRGDLDRNSQAIVNGTLTVNGHNLGVYPTDHNAAWTVAGKLQDALDGHAEPWVIELLRQISPKAAERYAAPQEPVADMQPERPVEPQPQREEPTPPEPEPAPVEEEVPPTTQEPNAPKNPWEMTREEYAQWTIAYLQEQNAEGREAIATGRAPDYYEDVIRQHEQDIQRLQAGNWPPEIEDWRRSHIRDAVAQGEPVPPEILAEYPDLAQPTEPEPAPVQAETGELPSVNELPREQQQLLQQAWKAYEEADEYLGQNDPRGIAALDRAQTLLDQAVSSKGKVNLQRYLDELRSQQQYPNEAPGAPTMEQVPPADSRTTAEPAPRLQAVPDEEIPLGEATAPEVAPQPEPAREGKARNSTLEAEAEVKDGVISLMRLGKAAVDIPVGQWPDDFDGQLQFIQERLGEDDGHLRAYRSLISKALEKAGLGPAPITFSMAESDGKVWVQFSKRPEESIRKKMGIMGFRWSKTASRWEAQPRTEADRAALVQSVQKLLGKYSQTEPAPEAQIPSPAGTGTQLPTGQRPTEEQPEPGGQPPIGGQPPAGGPPPDGRPPEGVNIGNPYTPGNDLAKGRGALTRPQSTLQQKLEQALDRVVRAMYDRVYPLKELEKITGIKAYTLARLVPGATMAGESVLEKEVRPIFANLGKEDVDNVQLLMTLERGLDLRTKRPDAKLPGGVEDPQRAIQELQQELGADWQVIREAADKLYDVNRRLILQTLVDAGLMSVDTRDTLLQDWPHYIPFFRQGYDFEDLPFTGAKSEANVSERIFREINEAGSELALNEPLAQLQAQVVRAQMLAARNKAAKALVDALEEYGKITGEEMVKRNAKGRGPYKGTVNYYENGEKKTCQVPLVYERVAKGMDHESANALMGILRKMAYPLRMGAVAGNPSFLVPNVIRDIISAWFREGVNPLSDTYINAWRSAIIHDDKWHEVARAGGFASGVAEVAQRTDELANVKRMGRIEVKNIGDALMVPWRLIAKYNEIGEQATRIAVWEKLKAEGVEELERALRTRDVTVDFAKSGNVVRLVSQAIPFLNAGIQGSANTLRMMRDNPAAALSRAALLGLFTILFRLYGRRFEDTNEEIPDYEYEDSWVLQIAEGTRKADPQYPMAEPERFPIYIRIPKGPLASLLMAPVEACLNIAMGKNDLSVIDHIGWGLQTGLGALSPLEPSASELIPPLIGTMTQMEANYDYFRDQPIIPQSELSRPPEAQYGRDTSKAGIAVGQAIGQSPRMVDFLVENSLGGSGTTGLWMADVLLGALGYNPEVPGGGKYAERTAAEKATRLPVVGRFLGTRGNASDRVGYRNLDQTMGDTRRAFYENPEVERLGMGFNAPGDTVTVNGVPYQVSVEQRNWIVEQTTPLVEAAWNNLIQTRMYQRMGDTDRRRMLETARDKIMENARQQITAQWMRQRHSSAEGTADGQSASWLWREQDMALLVQAIQEYQEYQSIPPYKGLSEEEIRQTQDALGKVNAMRRANPRMTRDMALAIYARQDPEGARLARLASRRSNPAKARFWKAHPLLSVFFGDLELEELGTVAPQYQPIGESEGERLPAWAEMYVRQ